jgi:hypothetical protein
MLKRRAIYLLPHWAFMVGSKVNFNFIFTLESKINFGEETDGEVGEFTASSYRLATSKIAV